MKNCPRCGYSSKKEVCYICGKQLDKESSYSLKKYNSTATKKFCKSCGRDMAYSINRARRLNRKGK